MLQGEQTPEITMPDLPVSIEDDGSGSTLTLDGDPKDSGMGLFGGDGSTISFDDHNQLFSLNSDQPLDDTNFDSLNILPGTGMENDAYFSFSNAI